MRAFQQHLAATLAEPKEVYHVLDTTLIPAVVASGGVWKTPSPKTAAVQLVRLKGSPYSAAGVRAGR